MMNTQITRLQKTAEQARDEAEKGRRLLKNYILTLQWEDPSSSKVKSQDLTKIPDTIIQATSVYSKEEIGNLLQASQSTLTLALSSDVDSDTLSAVFMPAIGSNVPVSETITYTNVSRQPQEETSDSLSQTAIIAETIAAAVEARLRGGSSKRKVRNIGRFLRPPLSIYFRSMSLLPSFWGLSETLSGLSVLIFINDAN